MRDLLVWEPGETVECMLCGMTRGGADPPGPWMRHRPSHRHRLPIWDARRPGTLGYFTYRAG